MRARVVRPAAAAIAVAALVAGSALPAAAADRRTDVPQGKYPFAVQIEKDHGEGWEHSCGAALVSERVVVTAAHCMPPADERDQMRLVFGRVDLEQPPEEVVGSAGIAEIVTFDWRDESVRYHDLAVLVLAEPRPEQPARLTPEGSPPPAEPGTAAVLAGWGRDPDGPPTMQLKESELTVRPTSDCDHDDDQRALERICAGEAGDSVRSGDSGGPLFVTDEDGISTQVGVVSGGYVDRPTQFVDVSDHGMWRDLRDRATSPESRELITDAAGLSG